MLRQPEQAPPEPPQEQDASAGESDEAAADVPPFDLAKLLAVGQALSAAQQDETAALILALKPHLSEERARRADRAVRLLRIWSAAGILRENGMLNDLFGGIL